MISIALCPPHRHTPSMFIRRTAIKRRQQGEDYFTYRLVESERIADQVKQHTLINLGRHFNVPQDQWQFLCARIKQCLDAQSSLVDAELPPALEDLAQRYVAQILAKRSVEAPLNTRDYCSVDLNSLELVRPRRVGVEQLALHAMAQLHLPEALLELGLNRQQQAAALGNIVARMAFPASERATHQWLQQRSGLGELIDYRFEQMKLERLYYASDLLWKHRASLQAHLYGQARTLFGFEETVTLYDLTNTFFEGSAGANPKARYGRSKEKRNDCPLVTLGLVLDGSGFPRKSEIFAGNVAEAKTLATMLSALQAKAGTIVVMDAGIASEENVQWLVAQGYRYIVVSRKRKRTFNADAAVTVKAVAGESVRVQRWVHPETGEIELYCHSDLRQKKEEGIQNRAAERFETALQNLSAGLHKKGTTKRYDKVLERLGRLREKYAQAAQHYDIKVIPDANADKAIKIDWERAEIPHTQATHPGVYCLRTNLDDWDEATLWKTYTMLTDLEGVFRSLKSELGMRPVYHHKEERVSGHIFITVLAYYLVHTLRTQLKAKGIDDSWETIRRTMENQQRVTATFQTQDGRAVHLRSTTRAEPAQKMIYDALGITSRSRRLQKSFV
jgi:transposase